jgi:hypothetical protein
MLAAQLNEQNDVKHNAFDFKDNRAQFPERFQINMRIVHRKPPSRPPMCNPERSASLFNMPAKGNRNRLYRSPEKGRVTALSGASGGSGSCGAY